MVGYDPTTDDVIFSLFAMSRPGRWFTWIGLPLARRAQAKFRPGSAAAVRGFVAERRTEHAPGGDAGASARPR